jgi:hypothetical protein
MPPREVGFHALTAFRRRFFAFGETATPPLPALLSDENNSRSS